MHDAFICVIVGVAKKWKPAVVESRFVDCEAVILRSDEATATIQMHTWLIVSTIAVSQIHTINNIYKMSQIRRV